ncbi:MAG: CsgG/HfaB family protein [Candidatus Sericytochromatia bacterium]
MKSLLLSRVSCCLAVLVLLSTVSPQPVQAESLVELTQRLLQGLPAAAETAPLRLAVVDLQPLDADSPTAVGSHLAEQLLSPLLASGRFTLLERSRLQDVIKEQGFSQSALTDPSQAVELGRLAGAELLLTGRYSLLPGSVQLNLRLVRVESGEIVGLAQGEWPKTDALRALLGEKTGAEMAAETAKSLAVDLLPLLLGRMQEHPVQQQALTRTERIFFEDFSGFAPGMPLERFGPGLVVRASQRYPMHVMTTEQVQVNSWGLPLPPLPGRDFVLEMHAIDTLKDPRGLSSAPLRLILRDAAGRPYVIEKQLHHFALGGLPPQAAPWRYLDWNVMALVKQGSLLSWYINGTRVASQQLGAAPVFQHLQVQAPSLRNWAFTRLALYRL